MGQIAGLKPSDDGSLFGVDVLTMLQAIGITKPNCLSGITSSNKEDLSKLGPFILAMDGNIFNTEDFPKGPIDQTDTDRILLSINKIGLLATLKKINGDFALALLDKQTNTLTLARDRFGIRPIYYSSNERKIGFASRLHSLLSLPFVSNDINSHFLKSAAAINYRFLDSNPTRSPFLDITQVPAGTTIEFKNGSTKSSVFTDWHFKTTSKQKIVQPTDYIDLFKDAVERRLKKADRPIFTLSGGLDSSAVVTMASSITGQKQSAISSIHKDKSYDEEAEIMDIVNSGNVNWNSISIDNPDVFNVLEKMTKSHDYPVPTATWMSHFILTEKINDLGFKSIFTGLGGDELHAGEYDYFFYFFADLKSQKKNTLLQKEIKAWIKNHDHPVFKKSGLLASAKIATLTDLSNAGQCNPDIELLYRYQGILHPDLMHLDGLIPNYNSTTDSYLLSHSRNELLQNTMPCCLRASYFNTSSANISDFHPFLDWRLFELMDNIPIEEKIQNGLTKAFARKAYKGLLPEATRNRITKTGWNAPAHKWFSNQGRHKLLDMISSRRFIERGIYNQQEVQKTVVNHFNIIDSGKNIENHMMVIWQIVALEIWLQEIERIPNKS